MTTKNMENIQERHVYWTAMDDSPYSEAWVTPYSLAHFLIGVITYPLFQLLGLSTPLNLILANALHLVYEGKDIILTYKVRKFNGRYLNFNSLRNSTGDHISFTLGQALGWKLFHSNFNNTVFQYLVIIFLTYRYVLYLIHSD